MVFHRKEVTILIEYVFIVYIISLLDVLPQIQGRAPSMNISRQSFPTIGYHGYYHDDKKILPILINTR